ncbi:class I SAM-dependent methyltransferase [candidate division CSSED10-310 bacterium]|uniref:Class I SAM-dependent methyltransferase n=1 Tax=candidate division CSSED10-310 bacterium TaxID=2855610 RepID=A0ABV6Z0K7_UNCC1
MSLYDRCCPFCFSHNFDILLNLKIEDFAPLNPTYDLDQIVFMGFAQDQRFPIVKCRHCGFVFSLYGLSEQQTNHLYSNVIDLKKSLLHRRNTTKPWHSLTLLYILFFLSSKMSQNNDVLFLDFGCGHGEIMHLAKACGAQCFGVEIELHKIKLLREQGFIVNKTLDAIMTLKPFDLVHCHQVLEHVPDPWQTLKSIAEVTKSGGYCFFSVPNFRAKILKKVCKEYFSNKKLSSKSINPWEHLNYFSPSNFREMLQKSGFKVLGPFSSASLLNNSGTFILDLPDSYALLKNVIKEILRGFWTRRIMSTNLIVQRV